MATDAPVTPASSRPPRMRPIRSFVLRQGRMSPAQQRALDALWPRFGIAFNDRVLDYERCFGRVAPVVLEIGFGMGETTAAIARARPDHDFVAVDVHGPGVGALLNRIADSALDNVRIIRHDAVEVVATMIRRGSLAGIHVYFPDPWPKKRHHKRRLVTPAFAHALAQRLEPGGYLHAATDWKDYAEQMLSTLSCEPLLANTAQGFAPRPSWRPPTRFEVRGMRLGHAVHDLLFRRR
ncbi:MAG TPA: tRNA (guanosine(46)-N7)-methyltransferase TrmB [Casimicrobiaceae bacterium]|nr:tRNA (guanosine(46)-N7)-methyltransferase TrmB [Casimicrobiaceae bacterium]